jgi:hypothetical protein
MYCKSILLAGYIFALIPAFIYAQNAQAVMKIKVDVERGVGGTHQKITIGTINKCCKKTVPKTTIYGNANELIEKDSLLLYQFQNDPNQHFIFSVEPVQKLVNQMGDEIIFIIDAVGYSHDPLKTDIRYFDKLSCNEIATNEEGYAYLWVDGRFFLPEITKGTFGNAGDSSFLCTTF